MKPSRKEVNNEVTEYDVLAELRSLREKLKAGMLEASKDELMALNEAIEVMKAAVEVPTPEERPSKKGDVEVKP